MRQYYRVIGTNETVLSCYWDWPPAEYLRPSRSSWPSWRWCRASLCRQSWPGKRQTCSCPAQTWSRTVAGKGWTGPVHLWQWENLKIGTKNQTIKSTLCPFYTIVPVLMTTALTGWPFWLLVWMTSVPQLRVCLPCSRLLYTMLGSSGQVVFVTGILSPVSILSFMMARP